MKHAFVFLEVFNCEGGIQSYIQDVLGAYSQLAANTPEPMVADVFLLRDALKDAPTDPALSADCFNYHYFKNEAAANEKSDRATGKKSKGKKSESKKSNSSMSGRIWLTLSLATYLVRHRPSHVYCGHINLASMVGQLCRTLKIPYTVLTYGKEVWYELPPKDKKALALANRVWTISRYSRDLACAANDVPKDQFDMLPCVVDGDVFTPGSPPESLIERYQLQNSRVLTTVARLWKGDIYKGVDVTIRALPKIAKVFPSVKYVVIGRGDDQPRLAQLAKDLGVADRVVFAGFVPDKELIDHYRLADVYVMPSQEGFGIVYLEAMACGIPAISGDDDGSADPMQDGRVGWQVPHRDPEVVAIACIEALRGEDQRCDGTWLRGQALADFSASALVARLGELLNVKALV